MSHAGLSRPWSIAWLALILAVGAGVRIAGLGSRGLVLYDAAYYANAAKTPAYLVEWFRGAPAQPGDRAADGWSGAVQFLRERGAIGLPAKPVHVFLVSLGFLMFGVRDAVVLGFSALCSVATIGLIYWIGRRLFDDVAGLSAAALYAVSGNSVAFARTGYPQADVVLLSVLVTWWYLQSLRVKPALSRPFLLASISSGIGVLIQPVIVFAAAACGLVDAFRWRARECTGASCAMRALTLGACLVAPYLLAGALYGVFQDAPFLLTGDYLSRGMLRTSPEPAVLVQLQLARAGGWPGVVLENIAFLREMFARLETPLWWVASGCGVILLAFRSFQRRSMTELALLWQILLPALYAATVYATLKAVQVALPALALGAGACASLLARTLFVGVKGRLAGERPTERPIIWTGYVVPVFLCVVLWLGAVRVMPWVTYQTGYQELVRRLIAYMTVEGGTLTRSDQGNLSPHLAFYFGDAMRQLPSGFHGRIDLIGQGGDYAVIDYQRFLKGDPEALTRLIAQHKVVARIVNAPRMLPVYHVHRAVPSAGFPDYRALLDGPLDPNLSSITVLDLRSGR